MTRRTGGQRSGPHRRRYRSGSTPIFANRRWWSELSGAGSSPSSTHQRAHELLGLKGPKVLELLPNADQLDRDAELGRDGQRDPALGRAVELGQDQAADPDRLGEE